VNQRVERERGVVRRLKNRIGDVFDSADIGDGRRQSPLAASGYVLRGQVEGRDMEPLGLQTGCRLPGPRAELQDPGAGFEAGGPAVDDLIAPSHDSLVALCRIEIVCRRQCGQPRLVAGNKTHSVPNSRSPMSPSPGTM
jgi:hypothetical protein